MAHIRVGMDYPLICLTLKNGDTVAGVPVGFKSSKDGGSKVVFSFCEVCFDDVTEVGTYDKKGDIHRCPVNCGVAAQIHVWYMNKEFTKQ